MKEHNYKMNISQTEFFNILGNQTLKDIPLSNLNRNTASDTTLYGSVNGKSAKLCPHPADKYKPFNPINEITAEERGTQLDVCVKSYTNKKDIILTRPPKVRPKKSNFGGRYFYVKIQL